MQIIKACFDYLYSPTKSELDQLQKQPWLVLLLIKWVLVDEQYATSGKRDLDAKKFMKILQLMHDLGSKTRMPSEYAHYALFFRNISYQQFLYQHTFRIACLARQSLLFGSVEDSHLFKREFVNLTGMSIERFLELALILLCRFIDGKGHTISSQWFQTVRSYYTANEIAALLRALSINLSDLRQTLLNLERAGRMSSEFYEQTPFLSFPLLNVNDQYLCVYPNVLFRALEHFIYDVLRLWDSSKFMAKFGEAFERYVEKGLHYAKVPYAKEAILKRELGGTGSVIDFLCHDKDSNILIDAKAVEMAYEGKVTHLPEIVKDRVKPSIIKAIEQAFDVLRRLQITDSQNPVIRQRNTNYLLVVTFKELYLGNGRNFYDAVAKDKLNEILEEYRGSPQIPLENMYFITVEEFDYLIEMIRSGTTSLEGALAKAKESDSDMGSRKFDFSLHLSSWDNKAKAPQYIRDEEELIFNKIVKILGEQEYKS
jgi:hypothetical protein